MKIEINGKTIWVNHNHLYYFYVVANEGKLEGASQVLSIGKPTLSTQIKQLEESLGVTLFNRGSRSLELTAQGKIAFEFAKEIYDITEKMVRTLLEQNQKDKIIRVGITIGVPKRLAIELYNPTAPPYQNKVQFIYGRINDLLKSLRDKQLEVVLTTYPKKEHLKQFHYQIIQTQPAVICGTEKFRPLIENFPRSLDNLPLIVPDQSIPIRKEFEEVLKKKNIQLNILSETNDENIAKLMAQDGLAPMLASKSLVQDLLDSEKLIEIGKIKELTNHIYALRNPN